MLSRAVAEPTFRDLSKEVVERFLHTVVVLDDGAFIEPETTPVVVREPDETTSVPEDEHRETALEASGGVVHTLDGQALITKFATLGLVCAVLAPRVDEDASDATLRASRRADIVIIDWHLGDEGKKALNIILRLIKEDTAAGGRLRMIVVYTASTDLEAVRDRVSNELTDFKPTDRPSKVLALEAPHSRILFIRKGTTSAHTGQIAEHDLPERLIDEFVEIGKGILANVSLGCMAAIREETHRVLARFHSGLDAPYLSHRILLKTPEDAEGYAVDLLGSEFLALLREKGIGTKYANRDAIRLALTELEAQQVDFRLMTAKDSEKNLKKIKLNELMKLVDNGPSGLAEIPDISGGKSQQRKLHERLYLLFSKHLEAGIALHHEFARTSAQTREQALVDSNYHARLDLGSILQAEAGYFLCIQPSCDTLRLEGPTQFIFASLSINDSTFDVVVRNSEGEDICLRLDTKASMIQTFTFDPDESTRTVLSETDKDGQTFKSTSGELFTWVCDLKRFFAQRFVHRIASDLSRIGLDEFEWQRRHSPRS